MPTFIKPRSVHVETGGGGLAAIAAVLGIAAAAVYLVQLLAPLIDAVLTVLAVASAAAVTGLALVLRRQRGRQHLAAPDWVVQRLGAPRIPSQAVAHVRAAPAIVARSPLAIEAPKRHQSPQEPGPVHQHHQ